MLDIGIQLRLMDSLDALHHYKIVMIGKTNFQKKASFSRVHSSNGRSTIFFAALAESDIGS